MHSQENICEELWNGLPVGMVEGRKPLDLRASKMGQDKALGG